MFRTLTYLGIATAVIAGPPLLYSKAPDLWKSVVAYLPVVGSDASKEAAAQPGEATSTPGVELAMPVEGATVGNMAEVFRFNVTPGWITSRWPRVSTGGAHIRLQGYRVPLVTGTSDTDIAGSLTYYFNAQQQVERITFDGTTGNANRLVGLMTKKYGFVRRLTNHPGLFVYEHTHADHRTKSLLTITSATVIKADDPYRRFKVQLRLEKPNAA